MARRINVEIEVEGEEKTEWIELSSGIDKAAMQLAWDEGMTPPEALAELTGLDVEELGE